MPKYDFDQKEFKSRGLIINLQGKDYLQVHGRYLLGHDTKQLVGMTVVQEDVEDPDWITFKASARVFNDAHVPTLAHIREACGEEIAKTIASELLFSNYDGYAKSPREGSDWWKALPPRSPERARPMEKAATDAAGRALGAAGFGSGEAFASADEVDSALARQEGYSAAPKATAAKPRAAAQPSSAQPSSEPETEPGMASIKQLQFIAKMIEEKKGIKDKDEAESFIQEVMGKKSIKIDTLTSKDCSSLINRLKKLGEPAAGAADDPPF